MISFLRRIFSRRKYDYQRILRKYSEALVRPTTDLKHLSKLKEGKDIIVVTAYLTSQIQKYTR